MRVHRSLWVSLSRIYRALCLNHLPRPSSNAEDEHQAPKSKVGSAEERGRGRASQGAGKQPASAYYSTSREANWAWGARLLRDRALVAKHKCRTTVTRRAQITMKVSHLFIPWQPILTPPQKLGQSANYRQSQHLSHFPHPRFPL